ncbi:cytochrome c [Egibacter rhizosphaerae]|uniref:Cytochrome c n=1 Tax=Egibacter rhizosphaerae TaxID=1670831 RepID=A0A411YB30_9ACTN|nr:cytochrome c [Egibacter rhizosphaerae]QBI18389.1 cytochrome c [Egibacter rhizosphaerae]
MTSAPRRGAARPLLQWLGVAVAVAVLVPTTLAVASEDDDADDPTEDPERAQVERGGEVYARYCVTCHGTSGGGGSGTGVQAGPPIDDTSVSYNDLLVRTGRMPIVDQEAGIFEEPDITDEDRDALAAWLSSELGLPGDIPTVGEGDPARGGDLYAANCMQCHGATGVGGISGGGELVLAVRQLDEVAIAQAIRVGPFTMPAFDDDQLDEQGVADIAAYTTSMDDQPTTPLGLRELDRVSQALAAGGVLVLVGFAIALAHRRPRQ